MVIFGGLELVAAGYILHKHNQNKRERRRLEEDAEILEEEQYHRRSHSHNRSRSYDDRDDNGYRAHNRKHRHDHATTSESQRPVEEKPQYLSPGYYAQPPRASSAPPQDEYYPPTGWPEHWKQSQYSEQNTAPSYAQANAAQYPQRQAPPSGSSRRSRSPAPSSSSRGRTEARPSQSGSSGYLEEQRHSRRGDAMSDRRSTASYDPPPEYRA
jgi:hypothetical protein